MAMPEAYLYYAREREREKERLKPGEPKKRAQNRSKNNKGARETGEYGYYLGESSYRVRRGSGECLKNKTPQQKATRSNSNVRYYTRDRLLSFFCSFFAPTNVCRETGRIIEYFTLDDSLLRN